MAPEPVTGGCVLIQWTEVSCDQVGWSFSQEEGGRQPLLHPISSSSVVGPRGALWGTE